MDLPDISHLPPWAAALFVVCLAIVFVVTRTGWLDGLKKGASPDPHQAQVAAVIVDPAALNRASAAVESLTVTLRDLIVVAKSSARATAAAAAANKGQAAAVLELREEVERLREEIIRSAKT